MQLVLGVAVADTVARLALVDASNPQSILDQFEVGIAGGATRNLVRTIVDTDKSLSTSGYRLTATNICWADQVQADTLRRSLVDAGVDSVTVVSVREAATAFVRTTAGVSGEHTSALLLVDDATAALSVVGPDAATTSLVDAEDVHAGGLDTACTAMIERLREETGGARTLYVISPSGDSETLTDRFRHQSPVPMHTAAEPAYVLARGAAAAAPQTSQPFTLPGPVIGEHLAYSMTEDSGSLPIGVADEYDATDAPLQTPMAPLSHVIAPSVATTDPEEFEGPVAAGAGRPRVLLLGSTVAAIVVVGFAVLAVGVAINIKPTVSQQAVRDVEAVPGKYLPPMPGQGVEPVEEPSAYLPPVVPVSATPPAPSPHTVYVGAESPGRSGPYWSSSGAAGGIPSSNVGAGGLPVNPGNPVGGTPARGFKLSDWVDLPDDLTINLSVPNGFSCAKDDLVCQAGGFGGCLWGRPGFLKCLIDNKIIVPTAEDEKQAPAGCITGTIAASCNPTQPLDEDRDGTSGDPKTPDEPEKLEPSDGGDKPAGDAPTDVSPDSQTAETPKVSGNPVTPETTPSSDVPKVTSAPPTTETTTSTTTRTTTSSSAPTTSRNSSSDTSTAPIPTPESAPPPAPEIESPAPAPRPEPVIIEAPAPVVEAPAPAPVAPSAPSVASETEPDESPSTESGSDSSSSTIVTTTVPSSP